MTFFCLQVKNMFILINKVMKMDKMLEREQRQKKLANLFFEMGMDLDLIEKVSGVDKSELLKERIERCKGTNVSCFSGEYDNYNTNML